MFAAFGYRPSGNMVVADQKLIDEIKGRGMRELMRKTRLSQHTIEAIRSGELVRRATLQRVMQFLPEWKR
jgi:Mor family transcriptional regulator